MDDRLTMTVTMTVTEPQALALRTMFEYWNYLGRVGSSRTVGFMCDGDGNFQPKCKLSFSRPIQELTDTLRKYAVVSDDDGDRIYDFDRIGWSIHHGKNCYTDEPLPPTVSGATDD